jgi:hypothetical protein
MQTQTESPPEIGLVSALHAQHLRIDAQLKRMQDLATGDDRDAMRACWDELEQALLAHLDLEEMHLLPRVRPEVARGVRAEHDALRTKLGEIGIALDLHTVRAEQIERLAAELRDHAAREDSGLYPEAERAVEPHVKTPLMRRFRTARAAR